jgi:ABC-type Mn2+/Zn2+ transport system permease subunit
MTQSTDRAAVAARHLVTVREIDAAARALADARYPGIAFGLLSAETQGKYREWAMAALTAAVAAVLAADRSE